MTSAPVKPLCAEDLDHVLAHTRELWVEARGQSIFITGGTGFFGTWLLESFARANESLSLGMRAVVLTRDPAGFALKAPHLAARSDIEYLKGDLSTFPFPAGHFDYLVHAAADTGVWTKGQSSDGLLDDIVIGTRHLLNFAESSGVRKFLLTSSGSVYGTQPLDLSHISEDYAGAPDPLLPGSAWGEGKRVAEHLCSVHAKRYGYEIKVARCFTFVGPHLPLDGQYAIGNFIRDAMRGGPIGVRGDGTPLRSYLYASDLAIWLWTILFRGQSARAYNVGSAGALSIAELADLMRRHFPEGGPVEIMQAAEPGRPVSRYVPAITRAATELGLQVRVPLDEAIRKTAGWHGTGLLAITALNITG